MEGVSPFPILLLTKLNNGCTRSYTFVLADDTDAILAQCIGRPIDPDWDAVNTGACSAMDYAFNRLMGTPQRPIHGRRGVFPTLYTGYSYGGGQDVSLFPFRGASYVSSLMCISKRPMNFDMGSQDNANAASWLCDNQYIRRIAHWASSKCLSLCPILSHAKCCLAAYAFTSPKAFRAIDDALLDLEKNDLSLKRPFLESIWPAVTFNLGHSVFTRLHRNFNNLIWSMCTIHALGSYDPKKGGHLILWDWKLVIEFPPGCTILIPSAEVAHRNIAVRKDEVLKSFTQYCAGGLIRWLRYGCRTEEQFEKQDWESWRVMKTSAAKHWEEACGMFSKISELRKDCMENLRFDEMVVAMEEC